MRIALLADYYPAYLDWFYREPARVAAASDLSFDGHREYLLADYFGGFISFRNWLRQLGHDADLIVANDYRLQQKWLDERAQSSRAGPESKHATALSQIAELRPDVLFVGSMFDYYGEFFRHASKYTDHIVGWIACPYPASLDFSNVRCVITSFRAYVDEFRGKGIDSHLLRAAFDPDLSAKIADVALDTDVSFVGSFQHDIHSSRRACLGELIGSGAPVSLWGAPLLQGAVGRWMPSEIAEPLRRWGGSLTSRIPGRLGARVTRRLFGLHEAALRDAYRGEAWGLAMFRTLARSKISLNFHIDVSRSKGHRGNMRMFEATGCGSLLLVDSGPGIEELFEPGVEIETYDSVGELREKITHYLDNPPEREAIASRGQRACLATHSYEVRAREFAEILRGL